MGPGPPARILIDKSKRSSLQGRIWTQKLRLELQVLHLYPGTLLMENKRSRWESLKCKTQITSQYEGIRLWQTAHRILIFTLCKAQPTDLEKKDSTPTESISAAFNLMCHALNRLALTGLKCSAVPTSLVNTFELPVTITLSKALSIKLTALLRV